MKKVMIANYEYTFPDGKTTTYNVIDSIVEVLLNRQHKINATELLRRDELARKIAATKENYIHLEDADYAKLKNAVEAVEGYGREDVEFVRMMLNPEEVKLN